jgi:hypothetical protein
VSICINREILTNALPIDRYSPRKFDEFFRCCEVLRAIFDARANRHTFELLPKFDNIGKRHSRLEIETYRLQNQPFYC